VEAHQPLPLLELPLLELLLLLLLELLLLELPLLLRQNALMTLIVRQGKCVLAEHVFSLLQLLPPLQLPLRLQLLQRQHLTAVHAILAISVFMDALNQVNVLAIFREEQRIAMYSAYIKYNIYMGSEL
jgi:hypothetical protein